jgi:hypothetical protein
MRVCPAVDPAGALAMDALLAVAVVGAAARQANAAAEAFAAARGGGGGGGPRDGETVTDHAGRRVTVVRSMDTLRSVLAGGEGNGG